MLQALFTALRGLLFALAGAAIWELALRRAEQRKAERGYAYWRIYHDAETLRRGDALRESHALRSTGVTLHIDVYAQPQADAPVLLFNHGGAGYCRLFVPLALRFHERGYHVIVPDQRGQGLSGGVRGDYTIAECTQNIVDVAQWARARFGGPIYIAGGSVGGALSAYAAAAGAPASAIACLNLFDFGSDDALRFSSLAALAELPGGLALARRMLALLQPIDWLRLPSRWLARFDKLMDQRDSSFQQQWDADPIPPAWLSLRSVASNLNTPPALPFEQLRVPALVLNQRRDQMVDPAITQRNFERLGGPKRYLELDYGHWSSEAGFWESLVDACDAWFRENNAAGS